MPTLREQCFGVLEGLDVDEHQGAPPAAVGAVAAPRRRLRLPDGESVRQFHARVIGAVRELARQHDGKTLLIVTHGGVLDMLWRTVHGLPLHGARDCAIPNTGINRLRWRAGTLDIVRWADDAPPGRAARAAGHRAAHRG